MRYIVTLFWSFVLGQVVGYIGGALTKGAYDFTLTTIILPYGIEEKGSTK